MGYPFVLCFLVLVTGSLDLQLCRWILQPYRFCPRTIMLMGWVNTFVVFALYMCDYYFNYRIFTFIFILDSLGSMLILITSSGKAYVGIKPSIFICRILFNHDCLLNDCLLASLDLPRFFIALVLSRCS